MTLKAVVDSLDDIPEALHVEYKEVNGKFYLDLDDSIRTHSAVLPLSNTLTTLKNQKAELQAKVTALTEKVKGLPEDFDPEKYQDIVTELEALKTDPNRNKDTETQLQRVRDQYEQRVRNAEQKRAEDIAAKEAEIAERDRVIQELVVDEGLTKSLIEAGVGKEYLRATSAMLKPSVKIAIDDETGKRVPVVESDLGEVPLTQFVDTWTKSDEGKVFVKTPSGGGAKGSETGGRQEANPWHKDSINLTQQGAILRTDKVKAERLMKAAQIPQSAIDIALGR